MNTDEQQLQLLEIFHYVVGGLTALFSCFPMLHLALGIAMVTGSLDGKSPPPAFLGWFFIFLALCLILSGWIIAGCLVVAGRKLRKRASRTFCLVVAGMACLIMPFGTILGVFTIIVLMRDSVKALFEANMAPQPSV
jgi:hypothetical protein